ncbi:MAG: radical SAM protein [Candidatus Poseidoniales archaeon]|jgi:hypothetical protein|tara:strand:+ start:1481 stop:2281 length:801 start_codon:yes stop_codon:yes gene_type:complete
MLKHFANGHIPEAEISLVHRCTLLCNECGFNIPNQSIPWSNPVEDIAECLDILQREGIVIGSLALLGGEATLVPQMLSDVAKIAYSHPAVMELELVTNGLTPQGLHVDVLTCFNRISISQYTVDDQLLDAWSLWVERFAPSVEVIGRRNSLWDRMFGKVQLTEEESQIAFDSCWYRKHCVTIERKQLFLCSRIPKFEPLERGLLLKKETKRQDVIDYLTMNTAPSSCSRCVPMAKLNQITPGIQPDDRIIRLEERALTYLSDQISN